MQAAKGLRRRVDGYERCLLPKRQLQDVLHKRGKISLYFNKTDGWGGCLRTCANVLLGELL